MLLGSKIRDRNIERSRMMIMVDCVEIFIASHRSYMCAMPRALKARVRRSSRRFITTKHFHSHHALAIYHIRERSHTFDVSLYSNSSLLISSICRIQLRRLLKNSYYSFCACLRLLLYGTFIIHLMARLSCTLAEF